MHRTESQARVSRPLDQYEDNDAQPVERQAQADQIRGPPPDVCSANSSTEIGVVPRTTELHLPDGVSSANEGTLAPTGSQVRIAEGRMGDHGSALAGSSGQSRMVVPGPRALEWAFDNPNPSRMHVLWGDDGCQQGWLRNCNTSVNARPLDQRGERRINQLFGTQDDSVSNTAQPGHLGQQDGPNQNRQHLSNGVCEQDGGNVESKAIGSRRSDLGDLFGEEHSTASTTHRRSGQHGSGSAVTQVPRPVQLHAESDPVRGDLTYLPQEDNRSDGRPNEPSAPELLLMAGGPASNLRRRVVKKPTGGRGISVSPARYDSMVDSEADNGSSEGSRHGDTVLADTALVPGAPQSTLGAASDNRAAPPEHYVSLPSFRNAQRTAEGEIDCMATVVAYLKTKKHTDDAIQRFLSSGKISTEKKRESNLRKWVRWCAQQQEPIDPLCYNPVALSNFLEDCFNASETKSADAVRVYKSSVAWLWQTLHERDASKDPFIQKLIQHLMKASLKKELKPPWDIRVVFDMLRTYGNNWDMAMKQLAYKTYMLLVLAMAWRPGSDMARIPARTIKFVLPGQQECEFGALPIQHWPRDARPSSALILGLNVKEGPQKDNRVVAFPEDPNICPVQTLLVYMHRTAEGRQKLAHDHTLFLSQVIRNGARQPVSGDTLRRWMKELLEECGLTGTAHAARGQASSAAIHHGASIESVLQSANWESENTFRKYYFIPDQSSVPEANGVQAAIWGACGTKQQ